MDENERAPKSIMEAGNAYGQVYLSENQRRNILYHINIF